MSRFIVCTVLMLCCFVMSGCRACSSPYLYCGPVDDMNGDGCGSCGGSSCDPLYRSGSVVNGYRGGVYHDGYYSATAQPIPYNDQAGTPIRPAGGTQKSPATSRQNRRQGTPAREYTPGSSGYSPSGNQLPNVPPPSLSRELLLHQERGAVDAKIIDVKDSIYAPTTSQTTRQNRQIRQVVYEDVQW